MYLYLSAPSDHELLQVRAFIVLGLTQDSNDQSVERKYNPGLKFMAQIINAVKAVKERGWEDLEGFIEEEKFDLLLKVGLLNLGERRRDRKAF